MNSEKGKLSGKEFLDSIWEAIYEAQTVDETAEREALQEAGIDPDELVSEGMALIKRLQGQQRFAQARNKQTLFAEKIKKIRLMLQARAKHTKEDPKQVLLAKLDFQGATARYRDLDSMDEDDMLQAIDDIEVLEQLQEELEKENGD